MAIIPRQALDKQTTNAEERLELAAREEGDEEEAHDWGEEHVAAEEVGGEMEGCTGSIDPCAALGRAPG